jgi:class 3 adenylate cyclase
MIWSSAVDLRRGPREAGQRAQNGREIGAPDLDSSWTRHLRCPLCVDRESQGGGPPLADTVIEIREPGKAPIRLGLVDTLEVGRDCSGLNLGDVQVSRRHVALSAVPSGLGVLDLGSTNGTFVNGERISAPTVIGRGDVLRLGQTEIRVLAILDVQLPSSVTETCRVEDPSLAGGGAADGSRPGLVVPDLGAPRHPPDRLARGTWGERWTFKPHAAPDGTITIVFSDIEDSSALVERLGDRQWLELLDAHHGLVRDQIARHGGVEVKSQGDGFMLAFPSALRALLCTVDIQRRAGVQVTPDPAIALRVRIAVHTGEVIRAAGDFFGRHVVLAARLASHAAGGETLVSELTRELVAGADDVRFGPPRDLVLRGLTGVHRAYPLLWRE